VFDAFTQVDASSTRRHGGTGLGLAIVKEIAELMGGRVGVDSRIAHGSTFWLELSLKRAADPASAPALADSGDAVPCHLRPRRPALRLCPRPRPGGRRCRSFGAHPARRGRRREPDGPGRHARATGLRVDIVDDGAAACDAAAQTHYDMVFHGLPHAVDGRLRSRAPHPRGEARTDGTHTPIVALTALALAGDRERCLSSGMDDYMTKPVRAAQLATAVQRWTAARPAL
jgi:CheY-like chemotaxis protein